MTDKAIHEQAMERIYVARTLYKHLLTYEQIADAMTRAGILGLNGKPFDKKKIHKLVTNPITTPINRSRLLELLAKIPKEYKVYDGLIVGDKVPKNAETRPLKRVK